MDRRSETCPLDARLRPRPPRRSTSEASTAPPRRKRRLHPLDVRLRRGVVNIAVTTLAETTTTRRQQHHHVTGGVVTQLGFLRYICIRVLSQSLIAVTELPPRRPLVRWQWSCDLPERRHASETNRDGLGGGAESTIATTKVLAAWGGLARLGFLLFGCLSFARVGLAFVICQLVDNSFVQSVCLCLHVCRCLSFRRGLFSRRELVGGPLPLLENRLLALRRTVLSRGP